MDTQATFMLVVTILDRGKGGRLADSLAEKGVSFNIVLMGRGTAKRRLLSLLGLGESEKDVLISGLPAQHADAVMDGIAETLQLAKPGKGIAFAIPILKAADGATKRRLQGRTQELGGIDVGAVTHNLIIAIMNHGYADDVMDTARETGAPGGTVVRAHGAGFKQAEKFLGITIQPDKDMLMILAEESACPVIMDAMVQNHGAGTDARTIAFTMPIARIAGLASLE